MRIDPDNPPHCRHKATVRVSSHENLSKATRAGEPIASTYCCERDECLDQAKSWVQGCIGREALVIPMIKPPQ